MSRSIPLRRLLRHPIATSESLESSALVVGAVAFVVSGIVATVVFWGSDAPIAGPGSVGQFVALAAGITALIVFLAARVLLDRSTARSDAGGSHGSDSPEVRLRWYDLAALGIAHGVIALLSWLALSGLFEQSFLGAVVFSGAAIVLSASATAVTAWAVFLFAINMTPMLLSVVLAVFLVVGTFASMLSSTDPLWWQQHLSTLGMSNDISSLAFNLTLIVAGVIVTIVAHYATAGIPADSPEERKGRSIVSGGLVLIGILLACVGLFPLDVNMTLHNLSASGMAAVFVTLVIGLRSWIPGIPRVFLLLGYAFVGVVVMLAVFYITGYYTLTAVELVAFLLIFSWLIVFMRNTAAMARPDDDPAEVGIPAGRTAGASGASVR
jgi:Protein of unknown function (DUF998)